MERRANTPVTHSLLSIGGLALACLSRAQQPIAATTPATVNPGPAIGLQSVDLIPLRAYVGGTPLRYGNIIPGSEQVQLNGTMLVNGRDYALDDIAGVIYLKVTQNIGDSLLVSYNYDPKAVKTTSAGVNGFQFSLLPGANLIMGMGLADRDSKGQVINSNLFGWKDSLNFGGKSYVSGLMLFSDQQGSVNSNQYTEGAASGARPGFSDSLGSSGSNHFVVQNYKTSVMGGAMNLSLQNISNNFANFNSVGAAGYSDADVKKFQAEKGLDRMGYSFDALKFGSLSVSDSMKSVQDNAGHGIGWKNMALSQGALKLTYSSQKVDDDFGRFTDLSEADKLQLLKERGMSRQNWGAQFAQKASNLSFQSQAIEDDTMKQGLHRDDFKFDSTRYKADYGDESVDEYFSRAPSLTAAENAQYGREVGTSRRWFTFSGAPDAKSKPLTFGDMELTSSTGKFSERDVAYTGKSWNIQHIEIGGSSAFASMAALQDADALAYVQKISAASGDMTALTPAALAADKGAFLATPSLRRDYTSGELDFTKLWHFRFDALGLQGATSTGNATDASLTNGKLNAAFHKQYFGTGLTEVAGLMPIEQARLGALPGLQRTDYSFSDQLSKTSKLSYSQMIADTSSGGAGRTVVDYASKGFTLDASQRKVDAGFANVGQMVDPEAAILASLAGFSQRDLKVTWNKLPNLNFTGQAQDARDEATGEYRSIENYKLAWNPNKTTQVGFTDNLSIDNAPTGDILNTGTRQLTFSKDFGKYGKFAFLDEQDTDEGLNATLPSSHKDYLSYERKLGSLTSFKVEQTVTEFQGGGTQGITAETISRQLTKHLGVSLTQAQVTVVGNANEPVPAKTSYGVWYDLGNGVRVSYGYAYQYNDGTGTSAANGLTVAKSPNAPAPGAGTPSGAAAPVASTPPTPPAPGAPPNPPAALFGPLSFSGGAGSTHYAAVPGGADHTSAFDNVAISTMKPLSIGPLKQMKFTIGMDASSDYAAWTKNSRVADLSGALGSNTFDFGYRGQLAASAGEGEDRGFKLTTSKSPKAWLQASVSYKLRTLPGDIDYLIRDYNVTAKPLKNLEISNQLQTNPEVVNNAVFLGSTPQAARSDKWAIAYHQGKDTTFGLSYQELDNQANNYITTTSGITLKTFEKSGSPISLFFGQEDDLGGITNTHRITTRYSLQFDQHPGPHQTFSMFLGNLSYDYSNPEGAERQNWTVRCDYQIRF
jgi:hypothetical protein